MNLPANFTPMMALGNNVLKRAGSIDPQLSDLVASHEFGHTGALIHSLEPRNLMFQGVTPGLNDCTDSLNDAQLTLMARTLRARTGRPPAGPLLAKRPTAAPRPPVRRASLSSFTPDSLRAMLAGDRRATRSFVELLFHGAAVPAARLAVNPERAQARVDPRRDQRGGRDREHPRPDDAAGDAQRTPGGRLTQPTPTIAPVIVCVVDTGMPSALATNSVDRRRRSRRRSRRSASAW